MDILNKASVVIIGIKVFRENTAKCFWTFNVKFPLEASGSTTLRQIISIMKHFNPFIILLLFRLASRLDIVQ